MHPTTIPHSSDAEYRGLLHQRWADLIPGSAGDGLSVAGLSACQVQAGGTLGTGAVAIEGTLDGEVWGPLRDPFTGRPVVLRFGEIATVPLPLGAIRPVVQGNDPATCASITVLGRSAQ